MQQMGDESGKGDDLHHRAEALFQVKSAGAPVDLGAMTPDGVRRLVHQLQVHQIELEMQNEELRRAQVALDEARARYFDLYNLAPLGYCTVDHEGLMVEANLTAVTLLGTTRSTLLKQPITRFILGEDQDIYYMHRKQLHESKAPLACELRMIRKDGVPFWVSLSATPPNSVQDINGAPASRLVLSDITERKRVEDENARLLAQLQQTRIPRFSKSKAPGQGGTIAT